MEFGLKTIERYILKRVAIASLGSTIAIVVLVWITQVAQRIDFATGSGGSMATFLLFMSLLIPQMITALLPFGIGFGAVQVLNAMNQDSEMPVISSAGFGRWRVARPFLIVGFIASLYVLLSNLFIEPRANMAARDVITQARTDLLTTLIQPGRFTKADDNLTIFVDGKTGGNLERIMISDTRDPEISLIYYAKSGAVGEVDGDTLLIMVDGEIHRKPRNGEQITIIRFSSYAISLSQFSSADGNKNYYIHERSTAYLLDPDKNDSAIKSQPGIAKAELNRRLSDFLYPILMCLVGLVLAGTPRSHRGINFLNHLLVFGAALGYRGLAGVAMSTNKITADQIYLFYLIPLGGIALSAWMYSTERTVGVPQFILVKYDQLANFIKSIYVRKSSRGAS